MPSVDPDAGHLPPPSHPPRLLSDEQILTLASQGHLPLTLPKHLASTYADLHAASNDFFSLPIETKTDLYSSIDGNELGYVSIPGEKEYVSFRAQTTHAESRLEQVASLAWQETFNLLYRVLSDLSNAMNVDHNVWNSILDETSPMPRQLDDATPTFLRIFRYDPKDGIAEQHTDMGLLTLCVCQGEGLQVLIKNQDGTESWTEYTEPTLLVGQTLRLLSGGLIKAGVHRVIGNPEGRGSIVYALRPHTKHEIDLSVFPGKRNQAAGVVHMSTLWKSIWSRAYNVNAPKEVRERQKLQQQVNEGRRVGYEGEEGDDITNTKAAFVV